MSRDLWWRFACVALFIGAAAWRLAYLERLRHTPFAASLDVDARIYWAWSENILRHGLLPPCAFYLAPLYPYALAAWRTVGGGSMASVLTAQAILGAVAVVLLTFATARVAGRSTALVVGVVLALFRPTTFFDGLVLSESLLFFVESLLVWFVTRADWSRAGIGRFASYGLLIGILSQGRASHAVLLALVVLLARTRQPGGEETGPPGGTRTGQPRGAESRRHDRAEAELPGGAETLRHSGAEIERTALPDNGSVGGADSLRRGRVETGPRRRAETSRHIATWSGLAAGWGPLTAAACGAFALTCVPSTLANLRASGELIPFTYNLGFNLYVGNNPDADGAYVDVTEGSIPVPLEGTSPVTGGALDGRAFLLAGEGRRSSPAESSRRWTERAAAFVRSAPLTAVRLGARKILLAWNRREVPQIESLQSFDRAAGPLGLPFLGTFGCLAVFGIAGAAWAARRGSNERWLVGYFALMSLVLVPFFVTDRYRLHLVPALAPLAGITLAEIGRFARRPARSGGLVLALALGLAAGTVFVPLRPRDERLAEWASAADEAMHLLDRGSYAKAGRLFARAESSLRVAGAQNLPATARTAIASFYSRYAITLEALGRHGDAILGWERAVSFNPNDVSSLGRLDAAYQRQGRTEDAVRVRRRLESAPGGRGRLRLNDGWAAAGRGDLGGAEKLFLEALHSAPDLSLAWEGLIRLRIQTGRYAEASQALDGARIAGLDPATADVYECFLAVQRGDLDVARRTLARIPTESPPHDAVLSNFLADARRAVDARDRGH